MVENLLKNKLISKKIFKISLCSFLIIGLVLGSLFLRETYINNQHHNMIVKTKSSGVWVFTGTENFFSVNTHFNRKVEIDKSEYEEIKDKITDSFEYNNAGEILSENDIVFNNDGTVHIDDFIFYTLGEDDVEYYKFNTITKSSEKINFQNNIPFINNRDIELIEVAVFNSYPNIMNEIEQIISKNPKNSIYE